MGFQTKTPPLLKNPLCISIHFVHHTYMEEEHLSNRNLKLCASCEIRIYVGTFCFECLADYQKEKMMYVRLWSARMTRLYNNENKETLFAYREGAWAKITNKDKWQGFNATLTPINKNEYVPRRKKGRPKKHVFTKIRGTFYCVRPDCECPSSRMPEGSGRSIG